MELKQLTDEDLVLRLKRLAIAERRLSAELARHLAEFDARRLYGPLGYSSLFLYCVQALGFSEPEAKLRIHAARAAAKHPQLLDMLERGETSLSSVSRLAPVLSEANRNMLLEQARGKTCREVEFLVAAVSPGPARRDVVRRVVGNGDAVKPVSGDRVRIALDASIRFLEKLKKAQGLLGHRYPGGGYEEVLEAGLDALLERIDPMQREMRRQKRVARTSRARRLDAHTGQCVGQRCTGGRIEGLGIRKTKGARDSRRIPQSLRDQVWLRDGGQCTFVGWGGRRCLARERLEIDHIVPWGMGGKTILDNLRLVCREHNQCLARQVYGEKNIMQAIVDRRQRCIKDVSEVSKETVKMDSS